MKAPHVILLVLLVALAGCTLPARLPVVGEASAAPVERPISAPATAERAATAAPAATHTAALAPAAPAPARLGPPAAFSIGVPAGDAYAPYAAAVDPARNLAYVYHADSVEKRPVISVVDLTEGRVVRLIRLDRSTPGAAGRLFLTPDRKRLVLHQAQDNVVVAIETDTGRLVKLLDGARDAVLSDDGRVLYAAQADSIAAYALADLLLGKSEPVWQSPAAQTMRLALNGARLLAARYGNTGLASGTRRDDRQRDGPRRLAGDCRRACRRA